MQGEEKAMTKDEALDKALEALEGVVKNCWRDIPSWRLDEIKEHISAIKQARSAPVQECFWKREGYKECPAAQRQWVGLERSEIISVAAATHNFDSKDFSEIIEPIARAIEAKLKEKNNG
jgi:hypothetical protein